MTNAGNDLRRQARGRFGRLSAIAAFVASMLTASNSSAAITLNANFDSGSACLVPSNACDDNGVASTVSGNLVTLVGRDNYNTNEWKWLYFSAAGVNGQQVTFEIGDDFDTGASSLNGHKMVYSYDQQNWFFFDNNARNVAQS